MFKRPTIHYGKSPEPVTPYQRAAQVWDDRIGSARVQAKNWRLAFFGTLALSGGLAAGLVWQGARGTIVPWVVQVDRLGEAQAVALADATYQPTDPQIAFHLARFIEEVRGIPADPIIVRQNWLRAYDFTTDKGALALNDYMSHVMIAGPVGQDRKIDPARINPGKQYAPVALDSFEFCLRVAGIPVDDSGSQVPCRHCAIVANRNHAATALADGARCGDHMVGLRDNRARRMDEGGPGAGHSDTSAGSDEQSYTGHTLKCLDVSAETGLFDAQCSGSTMEAAMIGGRYRIAQLSDADRHSGSVLSNWQLSPSFKSNN